MTLIGISDHKITVNAYATSIQTKKQRKQLQFRRKYFKHKEIQQNLTGPETFLAALAKLLTAITKVLVLEGIGSLRSA